MQVSRHLCLCQVFSSQLLDQAVFVADWQRCLVGTQAAWPATNDPESTVVPMSWQLAFRILQHTGHAALLVTLRTQDWD